MALFTLWWNCGSSKSIEHQAQMLASICFIRADKQEQLSTDGSMSQNSTQNTTQNAMQNATQNGILDLDFYLGIYGGEQRSNGVSDI